MWFTNNFNANIDQNRTTVFHQNLNFLLIPQNTITSFVEDCNNCLKRIYKQEEQLDPDAKLRNHRNVKIVCQFISK